MAAGGTGSRTYSFKVVLLGEGCVGKTSLVLRYCENKFNDKHITTLQVRQARRRPSRLGWPEPGLGWVWVGVEGVGSSHWPVGTCLADPVCC